MTKWNSWHLIDGSIKPTFHTQFFFSLSIKKEFANELDSWCHFGSRLFQSQIQETPWIVRFLKSFGIDSVLDFGESPVVFGPHPSGLWPMAQYSFRPINQSLRVCSLHAVTLFGVTQAKRPTEIGPLLGVHFFLSSGQIARDVSIKT